MDFASCSAATSESNHPPASSPRALPARASPHFAEAVFQFPVFELGEISDFLDAERVQVSLHHLADAGNLANIQRRKKFRLLAGNDVEDAIGLGLPGRDFRDETRSADTYRAVEAGLGLHALMQAMRGLERRTVQALGPGHVEVGLVDRGHFDLRRVGAENAVDFFGTFAVTLGMSVDKDGVRTLLGCGAQRHGRVNTELARFVGSGRDHSALVALSAYDDCLSLQRWIVELFHGDEEGVHIDMEDGTEQNGLLRGSHAKGILAAANSELVTSTSMRLNILGC